MSNQIFDLKSYYSHLKTKQLGRPCIYLDQVESTIDVSPNYATNCIVIAKEQLKGRGQRSNVWQSPFGCAMASIRMNLSKHSYLASKLSFIQHIIAISIARTLEQLSQPKLGIKNVKLKWPNDIIYISDVSQDKRRYDKLGGILVNTTVNRDLYDVILSFGLNVFNKQPTTCLSEILGSEQGLGIDSVIASTVNNLELLSDDLDDDKFRNLKRDYFKRCLHSNKQLVDDIHGRVLVQDVNDDGYLIGKKCDNSKDLCIVTKIIDYESVDIC